MSGSKFYFLKRHGNYFRPEARGYTSDVLEAGIYSKEQARSYEGIDSPIVEIIPISDLRDIVVEIRKKAQFDARRAGSLLNTIDSGRLPSPLRDNGGE